MINLSDNILEAKEQIVGYKSLTARDPNDDIPTAAGLTCRQAYLQFCYRMAKFDQEFATPDDVIGQSWLNIGSSRLVLEMEKRLLKDGTDKGARLVYNDNVHEEDLVPFATVNAGTFTYEYILGANSTVKIHPDPMRVQVRIAGPLWQYTQTEEPTFSIAWWPGEWTWVNNPHPTGPDDLLIWTWEYGACWVDAVELDEIDKKRIVFLATNSFTGVSNGIYSKVYIHREVGGRAITVWCNGGFDTIKNNTSGQTPPNGLNKYHLVPAKILATTYDTAACIRRCFVDTTLNDPLPFPVEFHNDLIDYAIDAYFESMFFHQFGKYSMKQARQDDDSVPAPKSNRTQKLDAVPPQRYRLGG